MRRYWFISDIHIEHSNVLHLTGRPFNNIQEMEQTVIENINKKVKTEDTLFLLGDICLGKKNAWEKFLDSLVCKNIILVIGNHDRWGNIPKDKVIMVADSIRLRAYGRTFLLSHYPYRCSWLRVFLKRLHPSLTSKKRPKDTGLWLLHGHNHKKTQLCDYHPRMFNVGVDANKFKPVCMDEIIQTIQRQESSQLKRSWKILKFLGMGIS